MYSTKVAYGKQTFPRSTTRVDGYLVRPTSKGGTTKLSLRNVFSAFSDDNEAYISAFTGSGEANYSINRTPASKLGVRDFGIWDFVSVQDMPDGTILYFNCLQSVGGSIHDRAGIIVMARAEASLIGVVYSGFPDRDSVLTDSKINIFRGNGDLLSVDELHGMGMDLGEDAEDYCWYGYDDSVFAESFEVTVLTEGAPKPELLTIHDKKGRVRNVLVKPQPRRRMRVKRGG